MATMSLLSDLSSAPNCTICLGAGLDNKEKGVAKLKCGHIFHLACIGSAFNARNEMKCPACGDVETGRGKVAGVGQAQLPEKNMKF